VLDGWGKARLVVPKQGQTCVGQCPWNKRVSDSALGLRKEAAIQYGGE